MVFVNGELQGVAGLVARQREGDHLRRIIVALPTGRLLTSSYFLIALSFLIHTWLGGQRPRASRCPSLRTLNHRFRTDPAAPTRRQL